MNETPAVRPNGNLEHAVREVFLTRLDIKLPSPDADLLRGGLVDSVILVELVLALETRFGVALPFESLEIEDFRTVPRIAQLVARSSPRGDR